jgi:glycine cleavage system H protein
MEGFSYVDLFATKGIEYVLVIAFLVAFIIYWRYLNRPIKAKIKLVRNSRSTMIGWFNLVKNAYYHPGHTWVIPEDKNFVKVGMDDFAQKLLGQPDSLELPKLNSRIEQGDIGWRIQSDSKSIDILSPISGEVIAVNEAVLNSPELMEKEPYGKGWLLKVKVSNMKPKLKNLFSGNLALAWMENSVQTLRQKMAGDLGMVMQDGGLPVSGFAKAISPDKWEEIASEFLLTH